MQVVEGLSKGQTALLIMDVFKGQMTDPVLKILPNNNNLLQNVSGNFTYLFQPQCTHTKKKFFIKDFSSKCDKLRSSLRIWSHLLKKSLMENFIFCEVSLDVKVVQMDYL